MKSIYTSPDQYIKQIPEERKERFSQLRVTILNNLPKGFEEAMQYNMISYVVPHKLYPKGYHCDPDQALPFISIASQKNFIAMYHMGLYADPKLLEWFTKQYALFGKTKPDMGKSCVRFKKPEAIPFSLIAQLVAKISPLEWVRLYELNLRK